MTTVFQFIVSLDAMFLYLARMHSGLTLSKNGELAGGIGCKTVHTSIRRFAKRLETDRQLQALLEQCLDKVKNDET